MLASPNENRTFCIHSFSKVGPIQVLRCEIFNINISLIYDVWDDDHHVRLFRVSVPVWSSVSNEQVLTPYESDSWDLTTKYCMELGSIGVHTFHSRLFDPFYLGGTCPISHTLGFALVGRLCSGGVIDKVTAESRTRFLGFIRGKGINLPNILLTW